MAIELSPSRLGRFVECTRCFWMAVHEGLSRPSGPFPSLPGGMDRIIKTHFDRYREREELPPELEGRVDARLHPEQGFVDRARDWRQEPRFTDPSLDLELRGGVDDLLLTPDGELVVLDYKTRGYPPKGDGAPDYYVRQLTLYTLLFAETGHSTTDHGYLLYYHPDAVRSGGEVGFHIDLVRVSVDLRNARALLEDAVGVLRGPIPDAAPDCEFCDWATERARY